MDQWVCKVCGYNMLGSRPDVCPFCGARHDRFVAWEEGERLYRVTPSPVTGQVTRLTSVPRLGLEHAAYRRRNRLGRGVDRQPIGVQSRSSTSGRHPVHPSGFHGRLQSVSRPVGGGGASPRARCPASLRRASPGRSHLRRRLPAGLTRKPSTWADIHPATPSTSMPMSCSFATSRFHPGRR